MTAVRFAWARCSRGSGPEPPSYGLIALIHLVVQLGNAAEHCRLTWSSFRNRSKLFWQELRLNHWNAQTIAFLLSDGSKPPVSIHTQCSTRRSAKHDQKAPNHDRTIWRLCLTNKMCQVLKYDGLFCDSGNPCQNLPYAYSVSSNGIASISCTLPELQASASGSLKLAQLGPDCTGFGIAPTFKAC